MRSWTRMVSCCTQPGMKTQPVLSITPASVRRQKAKVDPDTPLCALHKKTQQNKTHKYFCFNHLWDPLLGRTLDTLSWKRPNSEPTTNVVAHLHLPFFLAMSNAAEERLLRSSTGGKTIPLGFALPVSSQQRQQHR